MLNILQSDGKMWKDPLQVEEMTEKLSAIEDITLRQELMDFMRKSVVTERTFRFVHEQWKLCKGKLGLESLDVTVRKSDQDVLTTFNGNALLSEALVSLKLKEEALMDSVSKDDLKNCFTSWKIRHEGDLSEVGKTLVSESEAVVMRVKSIETLTQFNPLVPPPRLSVTNNDSKVEVK